MSKSRTKGAAQTPGAPNQHEIIAVPNKIQAKVGAKKRAIENPVPLAQYVLEKDKPNFEARFEADMYALKTLFRQMQETSEYDLSLLVIKVHEVRSEAGTFGYNLVTEIGRMLCEFLPTIDRVGSTEQMAIAAHLQAMQTVVSDKIKGQGQEVARQIIAGLKMIMGKIEN
ncbi:MAG: hypothetical protein O2967_13440 [Proteobacteria bacterium]|nr:hypothetical protein [Pseudomonadota bacterium]